MSSPDGKRLANLFNATTDGTASNPPLSFGGSFSNNSGTGIYGNITSMNHTIAGSSVMALTSSLCTLAVSLSMSNDVVVLTNAGVPTNGTSGTGAGTAGP